MSNDHYSSNQFVRIFSDYYNKEKFEETIKEVDKVLGDPKKYLKDDDSGYLKDILRLKISSMAHLNITDGIDQLFQDIIIEKNKHMEADPLTEVGLLDELADKFEKAGNASYAQELSSRSKKILSEALESGDVDQYSVYVHKAQFAEDDDEWELAFEYYDKALDELQKNESLDDISEAALALMGKYLQMSMPEKAIEVADRILPALKNLLSEPYKEYLEQEVKTWVFDPDLARTIILRQDYQEKGLEFNRMIKINYFKSESFMAMKDYKGSLPPFEHTANQINLVENLGEPKKEDLPENASMMPRDLLRADFDIDENADNGRGSFYFNRCAFFSDYAVAYHFLGQEEKSLDYFEKARHYYQKSMEYFDIDEKDQDHAKELYDSNMEELLEDIENLKNN